jgi:UDP-N-acetylglucosamine 2-epimerase (non-hydrolysing)
MACALVAAKLFIPVAHVEAGLRSFDRRMPEEVNRLVTDALSDLLFTPSRDADVNLEREGVERRKIFFVGNVMIDSLVRNLDKVHATRAYKALGFRLKEYAYVSLHRPSNVDSRESLALIMEALERLASTLPIVFPLHPRTRKMLDAFSLAQRTPSSLRLIEPVGYLSSLSLAQNAALVLTDSGGLQEETTFFRTPCLTLRPNTERPVTITQGTNKLTNLDCLWEDIETRLNCKSVPSATPELWDGNTSPRIAVVLRTFLGSDTSTDN